MNGCELGLRAIQCAGFYALGCPADTEHCAWLAPAVCPAQAALAVSQSEAAAASERAEEHAAAADSERRLRMQVGGGGGRGQRGSLEGGWAHVPLRCASMPFFLHGHSPVLGFCHASAAFARIPSPSTEVASWRRPCTPNGQEQIFPTPLPDPGTNLSSVSRPPDDPRRCRASWRAPASAAWCGRSPWRRRRRGCGRRRRAWRWPTSAWRGS